MRQIGGIEQTLHSLIATFGSVIGPDNAEKKFVDRSQKPQKLLLRKLAAHANVSPQNVYKAFTSSVQHKLTFLARTTPNNEDF